MEGVAATYTRGHMHSDAADEVLERALRSAHRRDGFNDEVGMEFGATWDHILHSQCRHPSDTTLEEDGEECTICLYGRELAELPQLPEMIFPRNSLEIRWTKHPNARFVFTALDALKMVDAHTLPAVQVAPSSVWQESRANFPEFRKFARPFDWTYTTEYAGTTEGLKAIPTEERVDLDRLRKQEPILFYAQVPLYEDELADHGSAIYSVRVRVMPSCSFVLARFYLRVDGVLTRVCDTRVFAERGGQSLLVEWTMREATAAQIKDIPQDVQLDPNQVSSSTGDDEDSSRSWSIFWRKGIAWVRQCFRTTTEYSTLKGLR